VPVFIIPLGLDNSAVQDYALTLSGLASLSLCYHWLPQIYETYKLKRLGSLSFLMIMIQSTGCVLTAYNLSAHGGWTIWVPLLIAAFMQYTLMIVIIYLHVTKQNISVTNDLNINFNNGITQDPLLPNSQSYEATSQSFEAPKVT